MPAQNTIQKTTKWRPSSFVSEFLHSEPAKPLVQCLKGPVWLESHWGFQKCCRSQTIKKHHTWRVGELRFIKPVVPDKLTLWRLEAQAQDEFYSYRVSTHNYSWHQLIGYLVATDLGQLQSTGVAMGYMQEIPKLKLIEAGTEYSILVRISYGNSWLLGHRVPSSLSKNI